MGGWARPTKDTMSDLTLGLAAIRREDSIPEGVDRIEEILGEAGRQDVDVVCFPETYLPGLRGIGLDLPEPDQTVNERALARIKEACSGHNTAAIVGMEWITEDGLHNRAYVISGNGDVLGYQTKNQITPDGEDDHYEPDGERAMFELNGVPLGVVVCHEGWRYPETVRWAATRGAKIVFHPQWTGRDDRGSSLEEWGETYYGHAMVCRAKENGIFFASVNVAMDYQNSATSLIGPDGEVIEYVPHGEERLLIADIDPDQAHRRYAKRYNPALYPE